jgi:xanthine dehydrogenase accessory factor
MTHDLVTSEPVMRNLCLIRGGGDLATGVAWRLTRAGFPVVVTELAAPLTVRRTVALSTAVDEGRISIEGMVGRRACTPSDALDIAMNGDVGVVVSADLPKVGASVVIDARLAKINLDTTIDDADLVVALGPGFTAGDDCNAVVETMRGPRLGRAIWTGSATANTGVPGEVGGKGSERVLRAPTSGTTSWKCSIGDVVNRRDVLGAVGGHEILAPFDGLVRGLIRDGQSVEAGWKIGDVDPRLDAQHDEISDKALSVGGGVLEAVLTWQNRSS